VSLFLIKPVVWNGNGYKKPGGGTFSSGFPKEYGYGGEEWNNSERYSFEEGGQRLRVFHTEGVGNQPLDQYPGAVFVFMIASYLGRQYLVGVAGGATGLFDDTNKGRRKSLAKKLKLKDRWKDVWALPFVQRRFQGDVDGFMRQWEKDLQWSPSWVCPESLFLWLDRPMAINPKQITGKSRLITMYRSYQSIGRDTAVKLLSLIEVDPQNQDTLENLLALCGSVELDLKTDLAQLESDVSIDQTTKEALVQARLGQGKFRRGLLDKWNGCAVTGCTTESALRASHIRPWRQSSNKQRLDVNNGLLLLANLDSLFDCGLISFDDDGLLVVSELINEADRLILGISKPQHLVRRPIPKQAEYLRYHRENIFKET
jgi:hypothetical protein